MYVSGRLFIIYPAMSCLVDACPRSAEFRSGFFGFCSEHCARGFWEPLPLDVKIVLNALLAIQGNGAKHSTEAPKKNKSLYELIEDENYKQSLVYFIVHQPTAAQELFRYFDSESLYALYNSNKTIAEFVETLPFNFFLKKLRKRALPAYHARPFGLILAIQDLAKKNGVSQGKVNWLKVWKAVEFWQHSWSELCAFLALPDDFAHEAKAKITIPISCTAVDDSPELNDLCQTLVFEIQNGKMPKDSWPLVLPLQEHTVPTQTRQDVIRSSRRTRTEYDNYPFELRISSPMLRLDEMWYDIEWTFIRQKMSERYFPGINNYDKELMRVKFGQHFRPPIEMFNNIFALRQNILDAFEIEK